MAPSDMEQVCLSFSALLLCFFSVFAHAAEGPAQVFSRPWSITGSTSEKHFVSHVDEAKIRYLVIERQDRRPGVPVVISPGRGETVLRYYPLMHALHQRGYGPFFFIDHRGQGQSFVPGVSSPEVGDVEDFAHYIADLIQFAGEHLPTEFEARGIHEKPLYLAHSMGGAILNLALVERPDLARAVVYIAPMFDIDVRLKKISLSAGGNIFARGLAAVLCNVGLAKAKLRMAIPPPSVLEPFDARDCSLNDIRRIEMLLGHLSTKVTVRWVNEALLASQRILKLNEQGHSPSVPSLIVVAARDRLLKNRGLKHYSCRAENCEIVELPAGHAVHNGSANVREDLVQAIDDFASQFQGDCRKDLM